MQKIYDQYRDRANFVTIYIKEAHPTDEWQMDANEEQGVCYPQPKTMDDRLAIARDFVSRFDYKMPLLVDRMDNRADDHYAGWPERLYIIDEQGTIVYKGQTGPFGYHPQEVADWLARRFGT